MSRRSGPGPAIPPQYGDASTARAKSQSRIRLRSRSSRRTIRKARASASAPSRNTPVEDVLGHVVGGVSDVGLRVDGEPWLALGGENIAGVEIGMKEQGIAAAPRELTEQTDTFLR